MEEQSDYGIKKEDPIPVDLESLIEIELNDDEDFLKIRETLTRIGIASRKDNSLYQSCHILHKRGKYYIVHFKGFNDKGNVNSLNSFSQVLEYLLGNANPDFFREKADTRLNINS